jgi:hypothetical protein
MQRHQQERKSARNYGHVCAKKSMRGETQQENMRFGICIQ